MECAPKQRKTYPNENRGKKLNEFSFLNLNERFNLDYYKKVPATYSALLAEYSGTEAEKIMRFHRRAENVGHLRTTDMIQNVLIELCEVGARLTEKQKILLCSSSCSITMEAACGVPAVGNRMSWQLSLAVSEHSLVRRHHLQRE